MTRSYRFLTVSIVVPFHLQAACISSSFISSLYQTNDHMNKVKHKAMNCETYMCTHIMLKPDHAFAALCVCIQSPQNPSPVYNPLFPWLCCPTDHKVTLSLANTSLITRLIIFFSYSYFMLSSFTVTLEN